MPVLPPYNPKQRGYTHDIQQWTYQDSIPEDADLRAWRTITALTGGPSGNVAVVDETGALKTTSTAIMSGDVYLNIDPRDGLNQYGEVDTLTPSSSADIVIITVPSDKKINLMGYSAEGSGLGDYRLIVDGQTQTRKVQRKALEGNFGFYGISFDGPVTVTLNVRNVETSLTTPCKNKNHMYFGNIYYSLEDL